MIVTKLLVLVVNNIREILGSQKFMRESFGNSKNCVWTVNPRYTSQTCHQCEATGIRVEDETSSVEKKGGEYFYCSKCDEHFHADINAARNIMNVQSKSSVVSGRTA
jgi:hypothetical protein